MPMYHDYFIVGNGIPHPIATRPRPVSFGLAEISDLVLVSATPAGMWRMGTSTCLPGTARDLTCK